MQPFPVSLQHTNSLTKCCILDLKQETPFKTSSYLWFSVRSPCVIRLVCRHSWWQEKAGTFTTSRPILPHIWGQRLPPTCCYPFIRISPPLWRCGPTRAMASSFLRFLDHTQRRVTVGRTPLDEWSARRRDLYLNIKTFTTDRHPRPPVGFGPTVSAGERP